ncbi:alpha/beta hydrolase family protein [Paenibacillus allorhizosphaerae]|uniref:AB hydrolase-1 domain-containing protein n=1 Tax=Paenibacillus allorhizosphaerae TaxID=2849866 RepID=A0ABN7TT86_9BACL|nr:alpha/beta fold hydrolase [Paenibacillus allorhizosphaerae]CAG7654923.1 hypothetical protein PAECIP111802_05937 [Paenibacillus allorhizosphaerae]
MDCFVGYGEVELTDDLSGVAFPMAVMYPTSTPGKIEAVERFSMEVSINSEPKEGTFPLVIISHGTGGSHLLYRTLAHHLASNGFIVGMPEHPFNNRNNNTLAGTVDNLMNRPRHIRTAIDWFFASPRFMNVLKADAVALIGHSMGGYTALAVAGGAPTSFPNESPDGQPHQLSVATDPRVKALVLLAPASAWFKNAGALSGVDLPILMIVGDKDEHTPLIHAQFILDGVSDRTKIQYRIVENAGHYSFLSPFPEAMKSPSFPPSQDPAGFHRESFHRELNSEVLDFLMRQVHA